MSAAERAPADQVVAAEEAEAEAEATDKSQPSMALALPSEADCSTGDDSAAGGTASSSSGDATSSTTTLRMGGDASALDALGPIVLNKDGSMSRIANWQQMTDAEQKNAARVISKRNASRKAALLAEQQEVQQQQQ